MAIALRRVLATAGLLSEDPEDYTPHLTLMKLSKGFSLSSLALPGSETSMRFSWQSAKHGPLRSFPPAIWSPYASQDFGTETLQALDLCAMGSTGWESYYRIVERGLFVQATP
eukprot:m.809861 g.809861  ORF g.809861 m.809861 type:complete len:113 (-) comp59319_c0_seq59:361-699(-)